MGYSCTQAAYFTLQGIENALAEKFPSINKETGKSTGNGWVIDGHEFFFERGRENDDGAITGTVYKIYFNCTTFDLRCRRAGSVRIEPDGNITRFSHVPKSILAFVVILGHRPLPLHPVSL
jgi:hypothetical protein